MATKTGGWQQKDSMIEQQSRKAYPHHLIEPKWQRRWLEEKTYRAYDPGQAGGDKEKFFVLDMFPYPSGAGLHVGHPEGYTATDIVARYKRMRGYNVLHPMGWDAFGLPAEQFAIKTGQHPRATTEANIATFRRQIQSLGFSYDWDREVDTTDPHYFKWTQWIFLQLYNSWFNPVANKAESIETLLYPAGMEREEDRRNFRDAHRLAYVAEAPVNWCPELGTVLANEEVIDGKSEVGGFPVVRRPMRQWMLRITAYAQRLLDDLEGLAWSDSLKEMQRNWIGRSEGALVRFATQQDPADQIEVFTTRPDTLWGATYMVLAPEHPMVDRLATREQQEAVTAYRQKTSAKSDLERTDLAKEKTGVFTGSYAINPVNSEAVPIWIADYVLSSYGTGAIMAVPAHDERDLEFAQVHGLPVKVVVRAPGDAESLGYTGEGVATGSGFLDGMPTREAKKAVLAFLEEGKVGKAVVQFKLRDWLFSRQRYWGEPFPIVWRDGHHEALPVSALPLLPPEMQEFKPTPDGEPPLARAKEWVEMGPGLMRETNPMPQWAGSCWYFLRYMDPFNDKAFCDPAKEAYWMKGGIDLYVGGAEHAVLHLLYSRFWHKVLFDLGHVSTSEPFRKLVNQGIILGEDGQKMSKSRGNVVNPDPVVAEFGADSFRCYEMFMGPLEQMKPWSTQGVRGVNGFLARVWRLFIREEDRGLDGAEAWKSAELSDTPPSIEAMRLLHRTIRKVTDDMEAMRFNTAISALMVWVNETMKMAAAGQPLTKICAVDFIKLLAPFAPHIAEEIWCCVGQSDELSRAAWPVAEDRWLTQDEVEVVIQLNGKVKDRALVPAGLEASALEKRVRELPKIIALLEGREPIKVIAVPGKLVNFVLGR